MSTKEHTLLKTPNGAETYRLRVPANVPAKDFWSVTLYDPISGSMLWETGADDVTIDSNEELIQNADESYDPFIGPDDSEIPERWRDGRSLVLRQAAYEASWRRVEEDPRVFCSSYEELVHAFHHAAPPLLRHAGVEGVDLAGLEQRLSMGALRQRFGDHDGFLFRRGEVGEHRELMSSERIRQDVERLRWLPNRLLSVWLDPRVLLKTHFGFSARGVLRSLGRLRPRGRSSTDPSGAGG